jgi:hypothetical protein
MAFPLAPPSSINCLALSAPIDRSAASAAEKNAVAKKQTIKLKISKFCRNAGRGGSMEKFLVS